MSDRPKPAPRDPLSVGRQDLILQAEFTLRQVRTTPRAWPGLAEAGFRAPAQLDDLDGLVVSLRRAAVEVEHAKDSARMPYLDAKVVLSDVGAWQKRVRRWLDGQPEEAAPQRVAGLVRGAIRPFPKRLVGTIRFMRGAVAELDNATGVLVPEARLAQLTGEARALLAQLESLSVSTGATGDARGAETATATAQERALRAGLRELRRCWGVALDEAARASARGDEGAVLLPPLDWTLALNAIAHARRRAPRRALGSPPPEATAEPSADPVAEPSVALPPEALAPAEVDADAAARVQVIVGVAVQPAPEGEACEPEVVDR